ALRILSAGVAALSLASDQRGAAQTSVTTQAKTTRAARRRQRAETEFMRWTPREFRLVPLRASPKRWERSLQPSSVSAPPTGRNGTIRNLSRSDRSDVWHR